MIDEGTFTTWEQYTYIDELFEEIKMYWWIAHSISIFSTKLLHNILTKRRKCKVLGINSNFIFYRIDWKRNKDEW
jgi:hypothetical protein